MAEESFILLSLKESKAKRLAQVISNETSRKILDYLAKKEGTESEIAKDLSLPISTVHYNLTHLVKNRLVLADEFHYSKKGREIVHYKLAKKLIVIAPEDMDESGIADALKSALPIGAVVLAATWVVSLFNKTSFGMQKTMMAADYAAPVAENFVAKATTEKVAEVAAEESARAMAGAMADEAPRLMAEVVESAAPMAEPVQAGLIMQPQVSHQIALWFFIGAVFALLVTSIVLWLRRRNRRS